MMSGLRLALRSLFHRPGFCAVVVLTLGLGIGATSAIFTVVNAVLLKPLPYREPDQLVMVWSRWTNFNKTWISQDEYFGYQQQSRLFEGVAAWANNGEVTITGPDAGPISTTATVATANLFSVLGMSPFLGRGFTAVEDAPNGPPAVMVGYQLWQRRWGGDRSLVGRTIQLDGNPVRVVGILPPAFRFPIEFQQLTSAQIVQPIQFDPGTQNRGGHCCYAVARMKPGITAGMVTRDLASLAARWTGEGLYPKDMRFTVFSVPLLDEVSGKVRTALIVLAAAVILLLALTCANVANLVLTRADARIREVAVRSALGAGRRDILRLVLTESILLGVAGGALGLALAWGGVRVLAARAPTTIPRVAELSVDWRVALFTLALSVGTGLLFGLAPLTRIARLDLGSALRDGRGQSGGIERRRGRTMLVMAEMALAVVILIGAGLTIRSFVNLSRIDAGFDARNVMTMRLSLPAATYATTEAANNFYRSLGDAVRQLPGVRAAGFVRLLPLATEMGDAGLRIQGKPVPAGQPGRQADWQAVSPGYFEAMKIRLVDGRFFDQRDGAAGQPVIIVNQELAKEYFPGENPVGQGIQVGRDTIWRTVIGVVGDVRHNGLFGVPKRGWYLPQEQWASAYGNPRRAMTLVIRATGDPRATVAPVERIVRGMDADVPLADVTAMTDVLGSATQEQRFTMALMAAFAALALVLAGVGIYGVISYSVSQRTREIGIRLALGADVRGVRALVLRQGMLPAAIGVIGGVVAAAMLTRYLAALLYGVAPIDAVTFTVIPLILLLVAAGSVFIPAARASRVEPVEALRAE
jgi:putative ABC transport system permease protein